MKVLITGGAGFLGGLLAARLLTQGFAIGGASRAPLDSLIIADISPPSAEIASDPRVITQTGELSESLPQLGAVDAFFHLAGVVSGAAEADIDLGMRINIDTTRDLLEWARHSHRNPLFVFTSSLAVFGSDPALGPIGTVNDDTMPRPQSSYGSQ